MPASKGPTILWEKAVQAIGALAGNTAVAISGNLILNQSFKPTLIKSTMHLLGWATDLADGPLYVGLTENHISVAEIKEVLEMNGPQSLTDNVDEERANRFILPVGLIFPTPNGSPAPVVGFDGQVGCLDIIPKWSWHKPPDESGGLRFFVYNMNGSAMNSESKNFVMLNKYYGTWLT